MTVRDPLYLDGVISTEEARLGLAAGWTPGATGVLARSGVAPGATSARVHQTATASANLLVDAGSVVIQGSTSGTQGVYVGVNDAQITLSYLGVYPADSNPRKDLIVARIKDDDYEGVGNGFSVEVIKGTASGSPVDPAVPASCVVLARVNLPASATTVADAVIDDLRTFTVARGGILPIYGAAPPSAPYIGQTVFDSSGRLLIWDGAAWNTPRPGIIPASSLVTADPGATSGTTPLTLAALTVIADGIHQIEIDFGWYGANLSADGDRFDVALFLGGTQVGAATVRAAGAGFVAGTPVKALVGPAAGSYTVSAKITRVSGSGTADVFASSAAPMLLTAKQFV
jgi:hypothetical protein